MSEWHAGDSVAIFGARPPGLGWEIRQMLLNEEADVVTYGLGMNKDNEPFHDFLWDARSGGISDLLPYDNVVVTTGINLASDEDERGFQTFVVNYHSIMRLAEEWVRLRKPGHFVVISSNSAHIARSPSIHYCASKAALSMGIRSLARREAGRSTRSDPGGIFYAWEFGLLNGTPMTRALRLPPGVAPSRIPDPALRDGLPVDQAAQHVVNALRNGWRELNGCCLRIDAGEQ